MEFIQSLEDKLLDFKNSINEILNFIRDTKSKWITFLDFWEKFFEIIPWELLILLLFCGFLLILLNSISPGTVKWNLSLGILLYSILYLYISHSITGEYRLLRLLYIDSFLLVPAYGWSTTQFLYKRLQIYKHSKFGLPDHKIEELIQSIHMRYGNLLSSKEKRKSDPPGFLQSIRDLKNELEILETGLRDKPHSELETSDETSNFKNS